MAMASYGGGDPQRGVPGVKYGEVVYIYIYIMCVGTVVQVIYFLDLFSMKFYGVACYVPEHAKRGHAVSVASVLLYTFVS